MLLSRRRACPQVVAVLALAVCVSTPAVLCAASTVATNTPGEWNDVNDWHNGVPTGADTAIVGSTNPFAPRTAEMTLDGISATALNVILGLNRLDNYGTTPATIGTLKLTNAASLTVGDTLDIGRAYGGAGRGRGEIHMSADSSITVSNDVRLNGSTWQFDGDQVLIGNDVLVGTVYRGGAATVILDGGTLAVQNVTLYVAGVTSGHLVLTNGATLDIAGDLNCGQSSFSAASWWSALLSPGTHLNIGRDLKVGAGTFTLDPAIVSVTNNIAVGYYRMASDGEIVQRGGTVSLAGLTLADTGLATAGKYGRYRVEGGGTLLLRRPASGTTIWYIGQNKVGAQLYLGEAGQDGTLGAHGTGAGTYDVIVRNRSDSIDTSALRGRGTVQFAGYLRNNGQVVADGFGSDADLVLTNFTSIANTIENAAGDGNGWFAEGGGRLLLPKITVAPGSSTNNWGEPDTDASIDLVNSIKLAFSGVNGGDLSISLLATNRTGVTATNRTVIGVWEIDGSGFDFGTGDVTPTFRYDDVLAGVKFLTQSNLKVWKYNGATWSDVTASIDTGSRTVTATPQTGFSEFAVSEDNPGGVFTGPQPPTDMYRTNAVGTWSDDTWTDSALNTYSNPRAIDAAYIGTGTSVVGAVVAEVSLTGGVAAVSNMWLGISDGSTYSTGTLNLAAGTALTVWEDLVIGRGTEYRARGVVDMGAGASLTVGGDLSIGQMDWTFTGDAVSVGGDVRLGYGRWRIGEGLLTVDGGSFGPAGDVFIGANSVGRITLTNGAALAVTNDLYVGGGYNEANGELHTATGTTVRVYGDLHFRGTYAFAPPIAAIVSDNALVIGAYRHPTAFVQDGGTVEADDVTIAPGALATVSYTLRDGAAVQIRRPSFGNTNCYVLGPAVYQSTASLILGDAASSGSLGIEEVGGATGTVGLVVRNYTKTGVSQNSTGHVRGKGTIGWDGELTNRGVITADGYGSDGSLVLTTFSSVSQGTDDTGDFAFWGWFQGDGTKAGWYAENGGKLMLPVLTNITATATLRWGDDVTDVTTVNSNDLANSLLLDFSGVTGGDLGVSLLATDHSASGVTNPAVTLGVWQFDTSAFDFGSGNVTVTFRYDDVLAQSRGLNEADLKVWRYDGSWTSAEGSVDTASKTVTSRAMNSLPVLAVSTEPPGELPPAGTMFLIR